jgi:hypothetical protein
MSRKLNPQMSESTPNRIRQSRAGRGPDRGAGAEPGSGDGGEEVEEVEEVEVDDGEDTKGEAGPGEGREAVLMPTTMTWSIS